MIPIGNRRIGIRIAVIKGDLVSRSSRINQFALKTSRTSPTSSKDPTPTTGDWRAFKEVRFSVVDAEPLALDAITDKEKLPLESGIPERIPFETLKLRPPGRLELEIE